MAKSITRQILKLFGRDGSASTFGEFGSQRAGTPATTKDIPTIQSLSAWLTGWPDAINTGKKAPYIEDMNAAFYVFAYQLFYLLQEGIPEWDSATSYYIGSRVRKPGTQEVYGSLTDDNLGNALPSAADNVNWKFVYPVRFTDLLGSIDVSQIPDGLITAAKIASLATTQLTGLITNPQINSMAMSKLTGGPLPIASGGTGTDKKSFVITPFTGNGTNGRTVAHGMGQTPDVAIVVRLDSTNETPVIWVTGFQATFSRLFSGTASATLIEGVDATNVTLGTSVVNPAGVSMALLCFKSQ